MKHILASPFIQALLLVVVLAIISKIGLIDFFYRIGKSLGKQLGEFFF
ncbi:hypothetical protein [Spirosoma horti]